MGRFYKTSTTPTVDYGYKYPFEELMNAVKYRQERQDAALDMLYTAKDNLTKIDYVPGSPDEKYLKQKQKEFDIFLDETVGTDLSLRTGHITRHVNNFVNDPKFADIQYNADLVNEQEKIKQELILQEAFVPGKHQPNFKQLAGHPDQPRISERYIPFTDPRDNLEAFFNDIDETVATDWPYMENYALDNAEQFASTGAGYNAIKQAILTTDKYKDYDINNPDHRQQIAEDLMLETAQEYYQRAVQKVKKKDGGGGDVFNASDYPSAYVSSIIIPFLSSKNGEIAMPSDFPDIVFGANSQSKTVPGGYELMGGPAETMHMQLTDLTGGPMTYWNEDTEQWTLINPGEDGYRKDMAVNTELNMRILDDFYTSTIWKDFISSSSLYRTTYGGTYGAPMLTTEDIKGDISPETMTLMNEAADQVLARTGIDPRMYGTDGNILTTPLPEYDLYANSVFKDDDKIRRKRNEFAINLSKNVKNNKYTFVPNQGDNLFYLNGKLTMSGTIVLDQNQANQFFGKKKGILIPKEWYDLFGQKTNLIKTSTVMRGNEEVTLYHVPVYKEVQGEHFDLQSQFDKLRMGTGANFDKTIQYRQGQLTSGLASLENLHLNRAYNERQSYETNILRGKIGGWANIIRDSENTDVTGTSMNLLNNHHQFNLEKINEIGSAIDGDAIDKLNALYTLISGSEIEYTDQDIDDYAELNYVINMVNSQISELDPNNKKELEIIKKWRDKFVTVVGNLGVQSPYSGSVSDPNALDLYGVSTDPNISGGYQITDITKFNNANAKYAELNNHEKVNSSSYSNLHWNDGNINNINDLTGNKVSASYTNDKGKEILNAANIWASQNYNGNSLTVNSLMRTPLTQGILQTLTPLAVEQSLHREGAVDFAMINDRQLKKEFIKTMEAKGFIVVEHGNHIHVSPKK